MKREWNNRNREKRSRFTLLPAAPTLALLVALVAFIAPALSSAAEIVPSYGITKSKDSDDTHGIFQLGLRGSLIPEVLQVEVAGGYRTDEMRMERSTCASGRSRPRCTSRRCE